MGIFKIFLILTALYTFVCRKQLYYHQMSDGTFLIAMTYDLSKNQSALRHQLNKHFHLPKKQTKQKNLKHQKVQYDNEMKNLQIIDIYKSADKENLLKLKDTCLRGKSGINGKEKLQQFKKGKCSPVVLVPGILATSLILQIDCQKLKSYDGGKIFEQCGWNTCFNLGIQRPDTEYLLWIGLDLTLKVTGGQSRCFGDLFGLLYNQNSTQLQYSKRYSMPAGLKSTWFGNTQKSSKYSKCGSNAIRDLSGHVSILTILGSQCALNDYARLIDTLQVMGYDSGLTLQALPYDFRYGILASKTSTLLSQIIYNLYRTTGKKVVIVAHSLGTLHTLSHLSLFMTQKQKQSMIRHYIPVTPPWFGTVSAMRNLLYGDPSYFTNGGAKSGINKYAQHKFSLTSGSTYELFLRDAFKTYRKQPWMQQILKRIQYQKQGRTKNISYGPNKNLQNGQQDYPLNWFPSKYQKCFDDFFKQNSYCQTGLIDFLNTPIFKVNDKLYYGTSQDIQSLLKQSLDQGYFKKAMSIWAQTKVQNKSLNTIPAPGVDTSVIYTSLYKTEIYFQYNQKTKEDKSDQNTFILSSKTTYTPGDLSVPSFSPLVFVSKWIHDNTNSNKSIKVIQYCGNYKGSKQHYESMSCQCKENPFKNQLDCTHPCIISDKYLIQYVLKILTNDNNGYLDDKLRRRIIKPLQLSDQDIKLRMQNCYNLKIPVKLGN